MIRNVCLLCLLVLFREVGYQIVEVNASDTRSKADAKTAGGMAGKTSNLVKEMVTSTALADAGGERRKQLLIMDEVDGMSGECAMACSDGWSWCMGCMFECIV